MYKRFLYPFILIIKKSLFNFLSEKALNCVLFQKTSLKEEKRDLQENFLFFHCRKILFIAAFAMKAQNWENYIKKFKLNKNDDAQKIKFTVYEIV
ncbi:hypothetical protein BpHYR1_046869 [Brachionus plicatilis]|uniref:Uncharacterized protein n=1 Tax=Brachionus plicatilis TaxID=10195 RepID=A0A3M7QRN7_BRAPC|nr:hypothetical protein BpHYR1_046869 [Brachionus plicatilis]